MSNEFGTMCELARIETPSVNVVVSYYTDTEGKQYEPRLRFVIGSRNRQVKGLTRQQAMDVRDAFVQLCDEWSGKRSTTLPHPSKPAATAVQPEARPSKPASKAPVKAAAKAVSNEDFAALIRQKFGSI